MTDERVIKKAGETVVQTRERLRREAARDWALRELERNPPNWSQEDEARIAACFRVRLKPTQAPNGSGRTD